MIVKCSHDCSTVFNYLSRLTFKSSWIMDALESRSKQERNNPKLKLVLLRLDHCFSLLIFIAICGHVVSGHRPHFLSALYKAYHEKMNLFRINARPSCCWSVCGPHFHFFIHFSFSPMPSIYILRIINQQFLLGKSFPVFHHVLMCDIYCTFNKPRFQRSEK